MTEFLSGKGIHLTSRKNTDKREKTEDESSQIRTRKVHFTGGGFAFPTREDGEKPAEKRKTSGRDAIIVEGTPGQANMKKQAPADEIAQAAGQKTSGRKSAQQKNAGSGSAAGEKNNTRKQSRNIKSAPKQTTVTPGQKSDPLPAGTAKAAPQDSAGRKQKNAAGPQETRSTASAEEAKAQNSSRKQKNTHPQKSPETDVPKETEHRKEQTDSISGSGKGSSKKENTNNRKKKRTGNPGKGTEATAVLPPELPQTPKADPNSRGKKKSGKKKKADVPADIPQISRTTREPAAPTAGAAAEPQKEKTGRNSPANQKAGKNRNADAPAETAQDILPVPEQTVPVPGAGEESQKNMKQRNNQKSSRGGKNNRRTQPKDHRSAARSADMVLDCRFSYSGRGFGFAVPAEPDAGLGEDIFIAPRASMGAMTGDLVQVRVFRRPSQGHSAEGEVTAVLERTVEAITGRLTITDDYAAVRPDNEKLRVLVYVPPEDCSMIGAKDGDKVEVIPDGEPCFTRSRSITIQRRKKNPYDEVPFFDTKGRITTRFGSAASREANYAAILHASGIRTEFPPYVKQAAGTAAAQPLSAAGRVDNRSRIIFTIDGADAKDLDDAISLEKNADGDWVLGVHIADVSHYVPYESCVEKEARARGTSVYFTDKVIPMLPEELSNGACSLNAGCDKYALSCEITLTPDGRRKRVEIYKSILRSTVRGVYSEVNDLLEAGDASPFREKYAAVYPALLEMRNLFRVLQAQASSRGVMELEDAEAKILLDENGFPVEIVRRERGDAEKIIEQFMLQANMGVAETLRAKALPCLYRIHEEPDRDKLRAFAVYAHNLGLPTFGLRADSSDEKDAAGLSDKLMGILAEANKKEIGDIVSSVLLRSMMKAKYVAEPKPHFGLGTETYCHFTSPIRRYPDLFVHTVLTAVLPYTPDGRLTAETVLPPEAVPQMLVMAAPERGVSSTDTEINAQQTEWKIEDLYMALYMSDKVGQVFDVTVVSVMKFGLFVQCENLVEGLIPAPLFPDAVVNEAFCTLRSGGTLYTLGTKMQARLVEADPGSGRITFAPLTENADGGMQNA